MPDLTILIRASSRIALHGRVTQALIVLDASSRKCLLKMRQSFVFLRGQEMNSQLRSVSYEGIPCVISWVDNDEDVEAVSKATGLDTLKCSDPMVLTEEQRAALAAYGPIPSALTVLEHTSASQYGVRFHASSSNLDEDFHTYNVPWALIEAP